MVAQQPKNRRAPLSHGPAGAVQQQLGRTRRADDEIAPEISGGFRSMEGAMDFAVIRSLRSTARKQGWDILQTLNANPDSLIANLRVA
jgi:hypothetical protein